MANKRMFSKSITNSSRFLMMPQSAQNLYFHLGMNADDDGFCEHFTVMRMTESKPDDLKILAAKGFVKVFDEKVLVVLDWKENNFIRKDRYTPSKYLEIYKDELKQICVENKRLLKNGREVVDQGETEISLGKDRLGKDRLDKSKRDSGASAAENKVNKLIELFKPLNPLTYRSWFKNKTQRAAVERLCKALGTKLEIAINTAVQANEIKYAPTITTPLQLEEKLASLRAFCIKEKQLRSGKEILGL